MIATDNLSQRAPRMGDMNKQLDFGLVDTCWCGEPLHPAYDDCDHCRGFGHVIGGDDYRPCSRCKLDGRNPR